MGAVIDFCQEEARLELCVAVTDTKNAPVNKKHYPIISPGALTELIYIIIITQKTKVINTCYFIILYTFYLYIHNMTI